MQRKSSTSKTRLATLCAGLDRNLSSQRIADFDVDSSRSTECDFLMRSSKKEKQLLDVPHKVAIVTDEIETDMDRMDTNCVCVNTIKRLCYEVLEACFQGTMIDGISGHTMFETFLEKSRRARAWTRRRIDDRMQALSS